MSTVSSAERAWSEPLSSGATTATVAIPSSRHARKTRSAISPRFATSSLRMVTTQTRIAACRLAAEGLPQRMDRASSRSRHLLPRIQEILRVERTLDGGVQLRALRAELFAQPLRLHRADAVLAGDRASEAQREREQLFGCARRELRVVLAVAGEQERRVQVSVARVSPRRRRQAETRADRERLLDRFREPVERNGDVLARLAAALRNDAQRDAVPLRRASHPPLRRRRTNPAGQRPETPRPRSASSRRRDTRARRRSVRCRRRARSPRNRRERRRSTRRPAMSPPARASVAATPTRR